MFKKVLLKIPYIFLSCILYKYAYIFLSLFSDKLTIHPIKNIFTCPDFLALFFANTFAIICSSSLTFYFYRLEQKIHETYPVEILRILSISVLLTVFSLTDKLYTITVYYQANQSYESWSITILCTISSILVLLIYFYYNEIAKNTTKEWYSLVQKMQSDIDAENDIMNDEISRLMSIGERIDSYSKAINSIPNIPEEIKTYYKDIKQSYDSLVQKVP